MLQDFFGQQQQVLFVVFLLSFSATKQLHKNQIQQLAIYTIFNALIMLLLGNNVTGLL
jgi:hypothetical protein